MALVGRAPRGLLGAVWDFFDVSASPAVRRGARRAARCRAPGGSPAPGSTWPSSLCAHRRRHARWSRPARTARSGEFGASCAAQVGALAGHPARARRASRATAWSATCRNVPAAVVGMLACAALGAVWSACAPDIGPRSAVDRFAQLDPVVLITADGYRFGGEDRDRRDAARLLDGLPTRARGAARAVLGHAHRRPRGARGPTRCRDRRAAGVRAGRRPSTRSGSSTPPAPPGCPRAWCTATSARC